MRTLYKFIIHDGTGYRETEYFFENEEEVLEYYSVEEPDVIVTVRLDLPNIQLENEDE